MGSKFIIVFLSHSLHFDKLFKTSLYNSDYIVTNNELLIWIKKNKNFVLFRPHRTLEHNNIITSRPPLALTEHLLWKRRQCEQRSYSLRNSWIKLRLQTSSYIPGYYIRATCHVILYHFAFVKVSISVRDEFRSGGLKSLARIFFPIACTKIKWFCPNITWFCFARKWLFQNLQEAAAPPPPSPMARTPI